MLVAHHCLGAQSLDLFNAFDEDDAAPGYRAYVMHCDEGGEACASQGVQVARLHGHHLDVLELNQQIKSGTKQELVERVVDGKLYGALPRCPSCGGGTLKVFYPTKFGHGGQGRPRPIFTKLHELCCDGRTREDLERGGWRDETGVLAEGELPCQPPADWC